MTSMAQNRILLYSVSSLVHIGNAGAMFWALHYGKAMLESDPDLMLFEAMSYRFITIWNLVFQITYVTLSLGCELYDLLGIKLLKSFRFVLENIRDTLFCSLVWPVSVTIFAVFWPLYTYDRELIFPSFIDKVLSQVSNHVMHSFILLVVLFEIAYNPRREMNHKLNLKVFHGNFFAYLIVLFLTYWQFEAFPYPMLKPFSGLQRFLFLGAVYLLGLVAYYSQWFLTPIVQGTLKHKEKKSW